MAKENQQTQTKNKPKPKPAPAKQQIGVETGVLDLAPNSLDVAAAPGAAKQAGQLANSRLSVIQRQRMAANLGQIQGNGHMQEMMAFVRQQQTHRITSDQAAISGNGSVVAQQNGADVLQCRVATPRIQFQSAKDSEENIDDVDMTFTVEEVLGDEAAENMQRDFQVQENSEEILYINMPEFIRGMGYTKRRMASIYKLLKRGRAKVKPKYRRWIQDPENSEARRQYDEAMEDFESTLGLQARTKVRDYWLARKKRLKKDDTRYDDVISAIMDPVQVPALKPQTRRKAMVTFDDRSVRFRTHQESRMAYYGDVYNRIGSVRTTAPKGKPAKTPSNENGQEAGQKKKFKNKKIQRLYDIFHSLQDFNVPVSEAKLLATIASGEGSFSTTQTIDRVRVSWGLIQFQGHTLMQTLRHLQQNAPEFFRQYFEAYGIYLQDKQNPILKPSKRSDRLVTGESVGVPSKEAKGVSDLIVYDHSGSVWVHGNEALAVIQGDPRYQAIFAIAGEQAEAQAAQLMTARKSYLHNARNWKMTLGRGKNAKKISVGEVFNSELAMLPIIDRKVHTGNVKFVNALLKAYMINKGKTPEDLTIPPNQSDFSAFVVEYTKNHVESVRWHLVENLRASGIPDLSGSTYTGD